MKKLIALMLALLAAWPACALAEKGKRRSVCGGAV